MLTLQSFWGVTSSPLRNSRRTKANQVRAFALLLVLVVAGTVAVAVAVEPGYDIWFAGKIVSVDQRHGTLLIARGPTQTSGQAIEVCRLDRGPLHRLRAGMSIMAEADTRTHPWRIIHLRIFKNTVDRPRHWSVIAFASSPHD